MKFHINKPPRYIRQKQKQRALHEWHEKFAWFPTRVDETSTSSAIILFEKYWRRGAYSSGGATLVRTFISDGGAANEPRNKKTLSFVKLSQQVYFKKKLKGEFDQKSELDTIIASSYASVGTGRIQLANSKYIQSTTPHLKNMKKSNP